MPTDTNQTIQDSRRAAMSILQSAQDKEKARNNRNASFAQGGDTDTDVERRPRLDNPDDPTDSAIEDSIRKGAKDRRSAKKAVNDFWRAAMRKGRNNGTANVKEESGIELADRIRSMSDEEFENALADGTLTPEQVRKAGEYDWDVYMGDVWSEGDLPDKMPEPTYEEFMSDPEKYGYMRGGWDERDRAFDRYARFVKKQ